MGAQVLFADDLYQWVANSDKISCSNHLLFNYPIQRCHNTGFCTIVINAGQPCARASQLLIKCGLLCGDVVQCVLRDKVFIHQFLIALNHFALIRKQCLNSCNFRLRFFALQSKISTIQQHHYITFFNCLPGLNQHL